MTERYRTVRARPKSDSIGTPVSYQRREMLERFVVNGASQ